MKTADLVKGKVYACKNGYVRQSGPTSLSDIRAMRFEGKGTADVDVGYRYTRIKRREGLLFVQVNAKGRKVQGAQPRLVKPQEVYGLYDEVVARIEKNRAARERARKETLERRAQADDRVSVLNQWFEKLDVRAFVHVGHLTNSVEVRLDLENADKLAAILSEAAS